MAQEIQSKAFKTESDNILRMRLIHGNLQTNGIR